MSLKRPKIEPIRNPTLFEMDKLEHAGRLVNSLNVERPYSEPGLLLGTSAFTANGWQGSFYPLGMQPRDFLGFYASKFKTVEIDSTYYATPSASTVTNWYERTPPDFIFAAKIPSVVTHEKVLKDCEAEFDEFVDRMDLLDEKLGPMLLQFPKFSRYEIQAGEFSRRLHFFLQRVKDLPTCRFVVEIRNKTWLDKPFLDLLREYRVALALTDTSWMPRPWEVKDGLDLVTTDFVYVRWLGDRKGIEVLMTTLASGSILLLFFNGELVSDVVFVDIVYVLHGFLSDLARHNKLNVPKPFIGIHAFSRCLLPEFGNPVGARVVRGEGHESLVQWVKLGVIKVRVRDVAHHLCAGMDVVFSDLYVGNTDGGSGRVVGDHLHNAHRSTRVSETLVQA